MKMSQITLLIVLFAAAIVFFGCSKDNATGPTITTDEAALQSQVVHSDSLADFMSSQESSFDDGSAPQDPEYGISKPSTLVPVVRYGRHVFWNLATRKYATVKEGDTAAVVTVTTTVPGELLLGVGSGTGGSVSIDSIIRKPFTETLTRKIRSRKIARTSDPAVNWLPVSMTLVQGKSANESPSSFHIVSLEFTASADTTITDPLNSWFRFGRPLRSGIPYVKVGDTVTVRVTVESTNDSAEVVNLRHGIDGIELVRGRVMMSLEPSAPPVGGVYTRVYRKQFIARNFAMGHPLIFIARFSAGVDAFSYNTLHDDSAPFENEFWGFPYITIKQ
jgi:hypothetical protein